MAVKTAVPRLSEKDFQTQVIDLAHVFGWKVAHFRPAQTAKGWRTPVGADGKGFPDLVLARERDGKRQQIFAELKTDKGTATIEQLQWLKVLNGYLWKPSDFDKIQELLK